MFKHSGKTQVLALALALAGAAAQAQTMTTPSTMPMASSTGYDANRTSWIPYTNNGYVGLNIGRSNYDNSCGALALRCDDSDSTGHIYLGGFFNPYFGAEIGYLNLGDSTRGGGRTSAHGINLSLVGRAPISENFSLYGKLGGTYGRTRVDSVAGSGITNGRESGWGAAYAIGANYDLSTNWSVLLQVDRQRFDYAGNTSDWVRTTSVGLQYHF